VKRVLLVLALLLCLSRPFERAYRRLAVPDVTRAGVPVSLDVGSKAVPPRSGSIPKTVSNATVMNGLSISLEPTQVELNSSGLSGE
jgi:hypothetical protein